MVFNVWLRHNDEDQKGLPKQCQIKRRQYTEHTAVFKGLLRWYVTSNTVLTLLRSIIKQDDALCNLQKSARDKITEFQSPCNILKFKRFFKYHLYIFRLLHTTHAITSTNFWNVFVSTKSPLPLQSNTKIWVLSRLLFLMYMQNVSKLYLQ